MRNKNHSKPNIYHIALLSACLLLVLAIPAFRSGGSDLRWINVVLSCYFGLVVFFLIVAFRKQLQYNMYSYNTILYLGFALFCFSVFATFVTSTVQCFSDPDSFQAPEMLYSLVHSAKNYMFLTSPLLLVFSAALLISNVALIRHEGRRFVNVLGIILAFCLMAGVILIAFLDLNSAFSSDGILLRNLLANLLAAFYLYFECMIFGAGTADLIAARYVPETVQDFLLVLGCGLKKDGTPTPLLKGRLDLALQFDLSQRQNGGKEARFVVSGGRGPDEVCSEAESMKRYLMEQGIPESRIITEDRSRDTTENMAFSKEIIDKLQPSAKVAFFTTNYHVFRAGLKARRVHMNAFGMGAPTRWYFWPNAAVREFVGLLTEHRGKQALVLLMLEAVYGFLTFLAYR